MRVSATISALTSRRSSTPSRNAGAAASAAPRRSASRWRRTSSSGMAGAGLRKGLEAGFTVLVEAMWPKRRILEVYLNTAEFAEGVFGAEAAARHAFGRGADALSGGAGGAAGGRAAQPQGAERHASHELRPAPRPGGPGRRRDVAGGGPGRLRAVGGASARRRRDGAGVGGGHRRPRDDLRLFGDHQGQLSLNKEGAVSVGRPAASLRAISPHRPAGKFEESC